MYSHLLKSLHFQILEFNEKKNTLARVLLTFIIKIRSVNLDKMLNLITFLIKFCKLICSKFLLVQYVRQHRFSSVLKATARTFFKVLFI